MKKESILTIKEFINKKYDTHTLDGFEIITDKQTIMLGIDNYQDCCESWGYFLSEDNINDFINSNLINIKITDKQLKIIDDFDSTKSYEGDCIFIDIITNKGTLQFVAYNEHDGYYGHSVIIKSNQCNENITI